jgi:hypothetical protein
MKQPYLPRPAVPPEMEQPSLPVQTITLAPGDATERRPVVSRRPEDTPKPDGQRHSYRHWGINE